ncbi:hypothetical protein KIH87_15255 [Paraneptunicella aestuarii]|uniref:hypothetical protein n=1 Tax=Paraneptunicella aestuarii TaxID=2831148 RepID=UPI001E4DEC4E|nr:hypothetical protein [Paraneptunicella aestuarii]UAA38035.1 hypothetical protein KIH87_15255 [Paraneptunicella aestuarii]
MSKTIHPARLYVKKLKDIYGGYRDFYLLLYGHEPETSNELQRFINYVNRGNYNLDFLELLLKNTDTKGITLEEFVLGTKQSQ